MRKKSKNNIIKVDFAQYQSKRNTSDFNHLSDKDIENFMNDFKDHASREDEKRKVFVLRPMDFSDVQTIINDLMEYETVIIVLKLADYNTRKRIMDFVFGACYALEGTIRAVSSDTFIVSVSNNVDVAIPYID